MSQRYYLKLCYSMKKVRLHQMLLQYGNMDMHLQDLIANTLKYQTTHEFSFPNGERKTF